MAVHAVLAPMIVPALLSGWRAWVQVQRLDLQVHATTPTVREHAVVLAPASAPR